jgi:hypothetical protein
LNPGRLAEPITHHINAKLATAAQDTPDPSHSDPSTAESAPAASAAGHYAGEDLRPSPASADRAESAAAGLARSTRGEPGTGAGAGDERAAPGAAAAAAATPPRGAAGGAARWGGEARPRFPDDADVDRFLGAIHRPPPPPPVRLL